MKTFMLTLTGIHTVGTKEEAMKEFIDLIKDSPDSVLARAITVEED